VRRKIFTTEDTELAEACREVKHMTSALEKAFEKAFAEAAKLPEREQEALAQWILAELESDRRWDEAFAASADSLAQLADEALAEHRAG
jgi:hypothetical protein